jgi:LysM repeat protein
MFDVVELLCAPRLPHVAVLALISIGFAGWSADMSTRLSQDSFSNPFASQPEATASVPAPVERRELPQYARPQTQSPQYQSSALPPPTVSAPQSYPSTGNGVSGGGRGLSSYAPPPAPLLETTGAVAQRSVAAAHSPAPSGTAIIVGTSDTLDILARRYNVSTAVILQANGYKGPRVLSPGQQLIIPRPTTAAATPASKAVATKTATRSVHVVNRGDTMLSIARRNHVSIAELAKANNLDRSAKLKLGMKLTVPGAKTAAVTPAAEPGAGAKPATASASPTTN